MPTLHDERIAFALMALAQERGPDRTFCPSEAARRLAGDWRPLMDDVRRIAATLQDTGRLDATQRGAPVRADAAKGPIRLALARGGAASSRSD